MTFQDAGDMIQQIVNEIFPFGLHDLQRLLALSYLEKEDGNDMIYYIKVLCYKNRKENCIHVKIRKRKDGSLFFVNIREKKSVSDYLGTF